MLFAPTCYFSSRNIAAGHLLSVGKRLFLSAGSRLPVYLLVDNNDAAAAGVRVERDPSKIDVFQFFTR